MPPAARAPTGRPLGRSGVVVPALGLGGAAIGNLHGHVAPDVAAAVLAEAWSAGVRYFDTAPLYGRGLGELRVGAALRTHDRSGYVLSSKVGWRMAPLARDAGSPKDLPFALHCDYSAEGTRRSVEDSLVRLGLERIDAVFVHDVDPWNHGDAYPARMREVLEGALPALHEMKRAGVVRAIGIAVNNCAVCMDFLRASEFDAFILAGRFTLLDQQAAEEVLPECARRGIGVIVGAPFNSGVLAAGPSGHARYNYRTADSAIRAHVERLRAACAARGASLMAAALQFPLTHPAVAAVLPGPRSVDQVRGIAAAFAEPVPPELWADLAQTGLIAASAVARSHEVPATAPPRGPRNAD